MPHANHGAMGSLGSVLLTALLIVVAITYLRGWWNLRSTPISISGGRVCSFIGGLFSIFMRAARVDSGRAGGGNPGAAWAGVPARRRPGARTPAAGAERLRRRRSP